MVSVFAHNLGVRNLIAAVDGDIFISDDPESVSSLNAFVLGSLYPLHMSWHRHPSLFEYDLFHVFLYLGWLRSWQCSRVLPATVSMTGMAHLRINARRGGVIGTLVGGLCQPVERAPLGQFVIALV